MNVGHYRETRLFGSCQWISPLLVDRKGSMGTYPVLLFCATVGDTGTGTTSRYAKIYHILKFTSLWDSEPAFVYQQR